MSTFSDALWERQVKALEVIAASMERMAHPLITLTPPTEPSSVHGCAPRLKASGWPGPTSRSTCDDRPPRRLRARSVLAL